MNRCWFALISGVTAAFALIFGIARPAHGQRFQPPSRPCYRDDCFSFTSISVISDQCPSSTGMFSRAEDLDPEWSSGCIDFNDQTSTGGPWFMAAFAVDKDQCLDEVNGAGNVHVLIGGEDFIFPMTNGLVRSDCLVFNYMDMTSFRYDAPEGDSVALFRFWVGRLEFGECASCGGPNLLFEPNEEEYELFDYLVQPLDDKTQLPCATQLSYPACATSGTCQFAYVSPLEPQFDHGWGIEATLSYSLADETPHTVVTRVDLDGLQLYGSWSGNSQQPPIAVELVHAQNSMNWTACNLVHHSTYSTRWSSWLGNSDEVSLDGIVFKVISTTHDHAFRELYTSCPPMALDRCGLGTTGGAIMPFPWSGVLLVPSGNLYGIGEVIYRPAQRRYEWVGGDRRRLGAALISECQNEHFGFG